MYELFNLIDLIPKKSHIIGYSMGGRIALELLSSYPKHFDKAVILSAHLGLKTAEEKRIRLYEEELLIDKIRSEGVVSFVKTWYQKPLFENAPVPSYRYRQSPDLLIEAIKKFSLAKQQNFWNSLSKLSSFATFLYGEHDKAYKKTVDELFANKASVHLIKESSHAIHLQNVRDCINHIERSIHADKRIRNSLESNRRV
jgi:2-succinyl-6-hydroxy-2,4-cyclohexadiene-1-carboxylate synthase